MDNGYGALVLIGIVILGITTSFQYTQIIGFTVIAVGFIALGIVGAMFRYLDNKNG